MADKPIIFSAPMVRALLEGRKTQHRVAIKPQPEPFDALFSEDGRWWTGDAVTGAVEQILRVHYAVGDRLWVRESHVLLPPAAYRGSVGTGTIQQREHPTDRTMACVFREGFDRSDDPYWRASTQMPRWASRLTLMVTACRVQRLQDISEADAEAEGVEECCDSGIIYADHRTAFEHTWNSLHGPDAWEENPWCAAYTFTVHRCNIDQMEAQP